MEKDSTPLQHCPGCHAYFANKNDISHPYIGASPGCWSVYGEILAKEFGEYGYPPIHRLTVDTYGVQHPGTASAQSIQSVGLHLVALYLALEEKMPPETITQSMQRLLSNGASFQWLEPPSSRGQITVQDVVKASSLEDHIVLVQAWAESVWSAWSQHHPIVRQWHEKFS
jgi:hypothetical protein